jgi:hypothetical protein
MRIVGTVLILLWTLPALTGCVVTGAGGAGMAIPVGRFEAAPASLRVAAAGNGRQRNSRAFGVVVSFEGHP